MLRLIICFILVSTQYTAFADQYRDSVRTKLDFTLKNKGSYTLEKQRKINVLKDSIALAAGSFAQHYRLNSQIIKQYEKFQIDSAISYVQKNLSLAQKASNRHAMNESSLKLAGLFSSEGKYIESQKILNEINRESLDSTLLPLYFTTLTEFCSHYGQSSYSASYYKRSELYRDSLLQVLDDSSLQYQIALATTKLYTRGNNGAKEMLEGLLERTSDAMPERAVIAYYLGVIAKHDNNLQAQIHYFSISAITDMNLAIMDNASLQNLALAFYEQGDILRAYQYIQQAIQDAIFCNVRYRTIESTTFYPLINAAFQEKERKEKQFLVLSLSVITVLSFLLLGGIIKVNRQKKKLDVTRAQLHATNQELLQLNESLKASNSNLLEASHIKEIYITQFFEICSSYIEKHEQYRNALYKLAISEDLRLLKKELKTDNFVKSELDELYRNFDVIFLNLYPNFISEFKELLTADQKIIPETTEFLTTELRIYALLKLGITDTTKIARFLRCSLQTIYNYRVKVRNNIRLSKEEFEKAVLLIGGFDKK